MKIGILTFHRAYNCGAMLQAWALKTVLERMGHDVGFVRNRVGEISRWFIPPMTLNPFRYMNRVRVAIWSNLGTFGCLDKIFKNFNGFRAQYLSEVEIETCDAIVVGSDQVWRPSLTKGDSGLFLGADIPRDIPMVSYAASFGDRRLDGDDVCRLMSSLSRYAALSAREQLVVDQIKENCNLNIKVVADPTLLLTADDFAKISCPCTINEPYIFAYAVHPTSFFVQTARLAAQRMKARLIIVAACKYVRWGAPKEIVFGVSPDRMVGYLQNARCVIASSFHGTALSIVHRKPFICLREDANNGMSRSVSFLRRIAADDRVVTPRTGNDKIDMLLNTKVSENSLALLKSFVDESQAWLKEAICTVM